jgi:hypothetical protein
MALPTTANTAIVPSQLFISALCQVKEEKYRNQPSLFSFRQLRNNKQKRLAHALFVNIPSTQPKIM